MFIDTVPNRNSPPAILLRESFRDGRTVRKRTLTNLSKWPPEKIEALRAVLQNRNPGGLSKQNLEIPRARPHGHVRAVLGSLRKLNLQTLIAPKRSRQRDLVVAMIVARILKPGSKLALARGLAGETLTSTLGELLDVHDANQEEFYEAMDWLLARQTRIETKLAKRHLAEGTLVLYDVTSTYFEGRRCPLARLGHSRDNKRDKLQIIFGLLADADGRPVGVEVFEGNTGDPTTLAPQVTKLRERFGLQRVILVGDRGMITTARIAEDLKGSVGLEWITALRGPAIKKLVRQGTLQLSLFDQRDLAEISSPDYPGERLIVCKNPLLADDRKRKRQELLHDTEEDLEKIRKATLRTKNRLAGKDKIALRVGKVLGRRKMGKHFLIEITDSEFRYQRNQTSIQEETALDGIYVIRTSLPQHTSGADATVLAYKRLSNVEKAFRSLKTVDLNVRPIFHRLADRVRAHIFLCMLAYYVEWHMRQALAPILFDDDHKEEADAKRTSPVAKAQRSTRAKAKAAQRRTDDGWPVHSFQTCLADLATLTLNRVQAKDNTIPAFDMPATPTPLQQHVFDLLGVAL